DRLGLDKPERELGVGLAEQPAAVAEHRREDHQPQLVDEPALQSACTSCPLPLTSSSPSSSGISSSVTTRVLFHSGSVSVLETTYFGMVLNLSANPYSS